MDSGDRILVAAGLTAAVVVGAFVLWGPGGAPRVRKRRGQIAGLQNLGRTCFLNTLLQALAACPTFIEWLKKYSRPNINNSMITTLYTVIDVVNGTHPSARGTPVCPLGVFQALRGAGWVVPEDQQDAHELLHVLMSCVEEETQAMTKKPGCLSDALGLCDRAWSTLASPVSPPSLGGAAAASGRSGSVSTQLQLQPPPRPASALPDREPELEIEAEVPASRGLRKGVSRSFCTLSSRRWLETAPPRAALAAPTRGTLASRLHCTVCNTKSPVRYDKFDSVSLPMATSSSINDTFTLTGLLRAFTAPEMVKGVRCSKCSENTSQDGYTVHIRTVTFGKLPSCLVLHIGRVQWSHTGLTKRSEFVAFPEHLSLAPYTDTQTPKLDLLSVLSGPGVRSGVDALNRGLVVSDRCQYLLVAAVVHVGGPKSGHFATYRRGNGFEAQRWWYTSDTWVHEVSLAEVLKCAAYMLFYEKQTTNA